MVSYQTFTRLGYEVARQKGAQFDGIQDGARFTSQLAELWNEDKEALKQFTEQQTREYLSQRVTA